MAKSLDDDTGDPDRFSALDLEKLYLKGGMDGSVKVQGKVLNSILSVQTYKAEQWYLLTKHGIRLWDL